MKPNYILLGILCLFLSLAGTAQISSGGSPISFDTPGLKPRVEKLTMPAIPLEDLLKEDELLDASDNPYRFGYLFEVDYSMENSGQWEILADGSRLWRLQIECPNALSINLNYSEFELPKGASLFLYNSDKSDVIGAFTSDNNKPFRSFSTVPVQGDKIILEYHEPFKTPKPGIIRIDGIVHGYRNVFEALAKSGSCNLDVICGAANGFPEVDNWRDQIRSVVALFTAGNIGFCSGALINNSALDCTPYILTARHCGFGTPGVADNNLFVFNFENSFCRQPNSTASGQNGNGSLAQSVSGMTVRATSGGGGGIVSSDFALIELSAEPPASYNVHYAGWSRSNVAPSGAVAIHHPSVDEKRISFENNPLSSTAYLSNASNANNTHWRVADWDLGTTEGGSSGSPLFDLNGRIIGQLSGGFAACGNNSADWYGKVWYSWDQVNGNPNNNMAAWLDPINSGVTFLDGADEPCATASVQFSTPSTTVNEESANVDNTCLDYIEFPVRIQINRSPSVDANVSIFASGSATNGLTNDFSFSPNSVVFPSDGSITFYDIMVRVYNDAYVEGSETINFSYTLNSNGGDALTGTANQNHVVTIEEEDYLPGATLITSTKILDQNFEGGSFPAGWSRFGGSGNGFIAFQYGDATSLSSSSWSIPTSNSSNFLASNDDGCDCGMNNDQLISPTIDLSDPSLSSVSLTYDAFFIRGTFSGDTESAIVQISANNGLYNTVQTLSGSTDWQELEIDLTPYIGSNNVLIRWVYNDGSGWTYGLAIDNVLVEGLATQNSGVHNSVNAGTTSAEAYFGPNSTVHFYDQATGDVMMSLQNLSNHDYGCTNVEVVRAGNGAMAAYNGEVQNYITEKVFNVVPENNNPTGDYFAFVYYTAAEINGWVSATGQPLANATIIKSNGDLTNPQATDFREENVLAQSTLNGDYVFSGFFASGFSSFAVGPGAGIILPIDLLNFKGYYQNNEINLNWLTATEVGNDHFELFRSFDGIQFEPIAKIEGAGTTNEVQQYEYLDTGYRIGLNYYQLKQVDIDGTISFSEVISVRVGPSNVELTIQPNPAVNDIWIQAQLPEIGNYQLEIFDLLGKRMYRQVIDGTNGIIQTQVDLSKYAAGVYLIRLSTPEGNTITRKMIRAGS